MSAGRIHGDVRLSYEEEKDETKTNSGFKHKTASSVIREEIHLNTRGDIFDSKLMTYMAGIGLGLNQQNYEYGGDSGSYSGEMSSYHVSANALSNKPYPIGGSFSRQDTIEPRRFQSPLHVVSTSQGLSTRLQIPEWPMTISWSENEVEQDSDFGRITDMFNRKTERFNYSVMHDFSERSHMIFRSDLTDITQQGEEFSNEYETARHILKHDYSFGNSEQHVLDTVISYTERVNSSSGLSIESEVFDWNENLRLRHSEKFSTSYNMSFSQMSLGDYESETIYFMTGFTHQLYKSLFTNFNVYTRSSEYDSGSESTLSGGNLRFDYTKENPWGVLTSEYSVDIAKGDSQGQTGTAVVIGESHVFNDPFSIRLEERDVVVSSIVVTNSDGSATYTKGDDYTVNVAGEYIELDVTPLGVDSPNISDGQDLRVDYLYRKEGSREEDYFRQFFRIEQQFGNGISIFYSNRRVDMDIDSSLNTNRTGQEQVADRYGIRYNKSNYHLSADHSELESTNNSSVSDQIVASSHWPLSARTTVHGRISQAWIESSGERDKKTSLFLAEGEVRTRLSRHLRLSGEVELRRENQSDIGRTDGMRFGTALEYKRRALSVRVGYDYYFLDRSNREKTSSEFYIRLIRRF